MDINQKAAHFETFQHIHEVRKNLTSVINRLLDRALQHDMTKMGPGEMEGFAVATHQLKDVEYGSDRYYEMLAELQTTIRQHHSVNSHHPEFYENGMDGMDLIDLLEMICDWIAATKRTANGDPMKSLEHNTTRHNISPQLKSILANTIKNLETK